MRKLRTFGSLVVLAYFAAGCDRGPETIEQCSARFARLAEDMPISAGRVHGIYTFDLSNMDANRLEQLRATGLNGGGRPTFMATNQVADAARKEFDASPPGPRGSLMIAQSTVLFRIPTGPRLTASQAVREGCDLIPGAKLQAVALTAG